MAGALVPNLGDMFSVRIDPTWAYRNLWRSPLGTVLSAVFMDLEDGIDEGAAVNYADTEVIGRGESIKTYMGTGSREVSLVFKFRAQGLSGGVDAIDRAGGSNLSVFNNPRDALSVDRNGVQARDRGAVNGINTILDREVVQPARWLDALRYPITDEAGVTHGPPPVILSIGDILAMRCVVTSCGVGWRSPWDPETMLPHGADVSVTFASVATRISNYNFEGPWRWQQDTLGGVDGPTNPFSSISMPTNLRSPLG